MLHGGCIVAHRNMGAACELSVASCRAGRPGLAAAQHARAVLIRPGQAERAQHIRHMADLAQTGQRAEVDRRWGEERAR
eukprot:5451990-Prymnesium_polylepis.2